MTEMGNDKQIIFSNQNVNTSLGSLSNHSKERLGKSSNPYHDETLGKIIQDDTRNIGDHLMNAQTFEPPIVALSEQILEKDTVGSKEQLN